MIIQANWVDFFFLEPIDLMSSKLTLCQAKTDFHFLIFLFPALSLMGRSAKYRFSFSHAKILELASVRIKKNRELFYQRLRFVSLHERSLYRWADIGPASLVLYVSVCRD
jgi:hypothetical protein